MSIAPSCFPESTAQSCRNFLVEPGTLYMVPLISGHSFTVPGVAVGTWGDDVWVDDDVGSCVGVGVVVVLVPLELLGSK